MTTVYLSGVMFVIMYLSTVMCLYSRASGGHAGQSLLQQLRTEQEFNEMPDAYQRWAYRIILFCAALRIYPLLMRR